MYEYGLIAALFITAVIAYALGVAQGKASMKHGVLMRIDATLNMEALVADKTDLSAEARNKGLVENLRSIRAEL